MDIKPNQPGSHTPRPDPASNGVSAAQHSLLSPTHATDAESRKSFLTQSQVSSASAQSAEALLAATRGNPPSPVKSTPASMSTPKKSNLVTNGASASPSNGSNVVSTPRRNVNADLDDHSQDAKQDSGCSSALSSPDSSSGADASINVTEPPPVAQPRRRVEPTFVSSLHFNPLQTSDVSSQDAILRRAKEGGMKRADRGPTMIDGLNNATPEPWIAGASSSAAPGIDLLSGPPDPARHPSRKMQKISKTEPLPFESLGSDPASKPCIPTHVSSPRDPPPRTRPRLFGLQECPTFYPTWEEFEDTAKYLEWVGSSEGGNGKEFGIVKIVPPEGWNPDFVLNQDKFRFRTRLQSLNSLSADARANQNYQEQLQKFHTQQGKARVHIPVIDKRPLDIYRLKLVVKAGGGYDKISRQKQWPDIARQLGYSDPSATVFAPQIKTAYAKVIQPFELFFARAKEQAKTHASPSSTANTPAGTSDQPFVAMTNSKRRSTETPDGPTEDLALGSRAGGSADLASTFAKDLLASGMPAEQVAELEADESLSGKRRSSRKRTEATSGKNLPGEASAPVAKRPRRGKNNSHKSSGSRTQEMVTLSGAEEQFCEICLRGDEGTSMLLCDECNRGYHMHCLDPPLTSVPKSDWYCPPCLVSTGKDYGFDDGETHSLDSFWKRANMFRRAWFEQRPDAIWSGQSAETEGHAQAKDAKPTLDAMDVDNDAPGQPDNGVVRPIAGTSLRVSEDDVEREFWRLVHDSDQTVEVEYGADIHSTTHGSALPTLETHPLNEYSRDTWNLNNLPILPASLLRYIQSNISGMTIPWIYVGMMFSAFCWHNEDHYTYSINYQHFGDTKTWYGVPGADAEKFEEAMRKVAPDLFETSPDLLFQLVTLISPDKLVKEGVRVYACDQRANEFVVTYPKAYHSGFNQGYNLNEAVNFALPDWIDLDLECVRRYQKFCKTPVFSHDELIVTAAQRNSALDAAVWLQKPMREMIQREKRGRTTLRTRISELAEEVKEHDGPGDEDYLCAHCKAFTYLSRVHSPSSGKHPACLDHTMEVCGADDPKTWTLRVRFTDEQLDGFLQRITDKADQPAQWRERLQKLLITCPRPPLRNLRTLLQEGEKIEAFLPEVADLRDFVDKANDWVGQATQFMPKRYGGRDSGQSGRRRRSGVDKSPSPGRAGPEETPDQAKERTIETLRALLADADTLPFDAPEIASLRETVSLMEQASQRCDDILQSVAAGQQVPLDECEAVLSAIPSSQAGVPQLKELRKYVARRKWLDEMDEIASNHINYREVQELLTEFENTGLPYDHPHYIDLRARLEEGDAWQQRAMLALSVAEPTTLEDLAALVSTPDKVAVVPEVYSTIEVLYGKAKRWTEELKSMWTKLSAQMQTDANEETYGRAEVIIKELAETNVVLPHSAELKRSVEAVEQFRHRLLVLLKDLPLVRADARNSSCVKLREVVGRFTDKLQRCVNHLDSHPMPNRTGVPDAFECFERMSCTEMVHGGRVPELQCSTCLTRYHKDCLCLTAAEEKRLSQMASAEVTQWQCPLCEPTRLPRLLSMRKTVPLDSLLSLLGEWYPKLNGGHAMVRKDVVFFPQSAVLLKTTLEVCRTDQILIQKWLREASNLEDSHSLEWVHHLLSRLMHSPVDYKAKEGSDKAETVVERCAGALYRRHGMDTAGKRILDVASDPARISDAPGAPVDQGQFGQPDQNGGEHRRKRGKRAKFTLREEQPLKRDHEAAPDGGPPPRCLCGGSSKPGARIRCKRCLHWFHMSCMKLDETADNEALLGKFVCPPCCIKVEKRYPHAEVKVKDCAQPADKEDLWLDIRTSLRSETGPISKRQTWSAEPDKRIVLHLTHYRPAVRGDALEEELRAQKRRKEAAKADARAGHTLEPVGAPRDPALLSQDRTGNGRAESVATVNTNAAAQASVSGVHSPSTSASSTQQHPGAGAEHSASVEQISRPASVLSVSSLSTGSIPSGSRITGEAGSTVPGKTASTNATQGQPGSSSAIRGDTTATSAPHGHTASTGATRGDETVSGATATPAASPGQRAPSRGWNREEWQRGMDNLYSRGVTDAMIDKYYVGWNGQDLVFPYVDSRTQRQVYCVLGPTIRVDADDPDGTRVITEAMRRHRHRQQHRQPQQQAHHQGQHQDQRQQQHQTNHQQQHQDQRQQHHHGQRQQQHQANHHQQQHQDPRQQQQHVHQGDQQSHHRQLAGHHQQPAPQAAQHQPHREQHGHMQ